MLSAPAVRHPFAKLSVKLVGFSLVYWPGNKKGEAVKNAVLLIENARIYWVFLIRKTPKDNSHKGLWHGELVVNFGNFLQQLKL